MILSTICFLLILLYLLVLIILFFMVAARKNEPVLSYQQHERPFISVLVAARNEEQNILSCLQSLAELDYPLDKMEILVGNDQSDDNTRDLILQFAQSFPQVKLVDIHGQLGMAKGKANVLAQLAQKARGDFYLITDADIVVNTRWAKEMISHFTTPELGIVSATTLVHGPAQTDRLQGIDWLYYMGLLKGADNLGLHCTAVGNNMAIRKEAYRAVGGYESLPFSVTEDFKLYKEVRKQKWATLNILSADTLNISKPVNPFLPLLHQRKRWLMGGGELPIYWWALFGLLASFFPAIIILAFYKPLLALQLYLIKVGVQSLFVLFLQRKLSLRHHIADVLLYDLYATVVSISTQLFFVLPVTMRWKNRKYR